MRNWLLRVGAGSIGLVAFSSPCLAQDVEHVRANGARLQIDEVKGRVSVWAVAPNVLRFDYLPNGVEPLPTPMLLPKGLRASHPVGRVEARELRTSEMTASLERQNLVVSSLSGRCSVAIDLEASVLGSGGLLLRHDPKEHLYGMRGYGIPKSGDPRLDPKEGLFRDAGAPVQAGVQGDGGAPIAFTPSWGLLIDSIDGDFATHADSLEFTNGSRKDIEGYLVIGPPKEFMRVVADLTGHPPMPPKWSLGFLNSQWGDDESIIRSQVAQYREKKIPLDAFILDFDYKAWGEDNYGEFRWNSTSAPGNVGPNKFPNGANGKFASDLLAQGVHLVGIMKPRVLVTNTEGQPTAAARDGGLHGWFLPGEKPYEDYFSHRPALDIDFSTVGARTWYWQHAQGLFDAGIAGWWNDEADGGFPSLGFFQMQQALYEGQRGVSNNRVWSVNRNFYIGAQRYGFATWSGDIRTGFTSMDAQPLRMLAALDIGQPNWTMDGGGFNGHPSPECYARWLEFASLCPIMRVHGTYGERRQPWVYGPVAETAVKKAIEFRYRLLPYLYSLARETNETGIGAVRPLFWEFPSDPGSANVIDSWMIGSSLLAAPVLKPGDSVRHVYLPPGTWFDFASDKPVEGGRAVDMPVDPDTWTDVPLFVRSGSILATGPIRQTTGEPSKGQTTLDVWPDAHHPAQFVVYDDDGTTYDYEKGHYFSQTIEAKRGSSSVTIVFGPQKGRWSSPLKSYLVRLHACPAYALKINGKPAPVHGSAGLEEFTVPAGRATTVALN